MSKPKVATALSSCFGGHMSVLDIDERILELVELIDFDKSPITDIKKFTGRCAVGIVEGGCCNQENVEVLRSFRENCDVLIALGDCATMGGIPALRNNVPLQECTVPPCTTPAVSFPTTRICRCSWTGSTPSRTS